MKKIIKEYLFITIPLVIFAYINLIGLVFELLNEKSDLSFFIGITLFTIILLLTYLLIKFIKKL